MYEKYLPISFFRNFTIEIMNFIGTKKAGNKTMSGWDKITYISGNRNTVIDIGDGNAKYIVGQRYVTTTRARFF